MAYTLQMYCLTKGSAMDIATCERVMKLVQYLLEDSIVVITDKVERATYVLSYNLAADCWEHLTDRMWVKRFAPIILD